MNDIARTGPMAGAYERALRFAPPVLAAKLRGTVGDGYWLDDRRYFFTVTEDDGAGGIVTRPKIADAVKGEVADVLPVQTIAALVAANGGDAGQLSTAQYDVIDGRELTVMVGQQAFMISIDATAICRVETLTPGFALHSPDGRHAVYLKDHALWLRSRDDGTVRQLSPDGEAHNAYGAAQESSTTPLTTRMLAMPQGLWSADGEWFVTHRIDERHLPEGALLQHAPLGGGAPVLHRFKFAPLDAAVPQAEFIAFHLPSGRIVRAADRRVGVNGVSPFMGRECWFAGDSLWFLDWGRFSDSVALVEKPLDGRPSRTVLTERADSGWIDLGMPFVGQPMIRILRQTNELIFFSDVEGQRHLRLHALDSGALKHSITQGPWVVREIVHVDEAARSILFLASGFADASDPVHRRLCRINFDGSGFETLLADDGDVVIVFDPVSGVQQLRPFRPSYARSGVSPDGRHVVAQINAIDRPSRTLLVDLASGRRTELAHTNIDALWTAPQPQPFEVLAADGMTKLRGLLLFPTDFEPTRSYPLLDFIYPGNALNWLFRRFPNLPALTLQALIEPGMVGVLLETRAMPHRDRAFHQAGQGSIIEPQLSDHAAAIAQLCERHGFLDRDRVGIFGWSGGGYAAARAMFDYPETFKVGVAVAGNHDNRHFASFWIDKYGGRPGTPERDHQANGPQAHKLSGKLFLIAGDMDETCHPAHTLALSAALTAAGKDHDQWIVANGSHDLALDTPAVLQRICDYFVRHLIGAEPPSGLRWDWSAQHYAAAMQMRWTDLA